jgi:hypothetical protein
MPTIKYKLADGTPVCGTTTIIGKNLGWNKEQLKYWAWKEGQAGRDIRRTTQRAADAGTIAHYLIECDLLKAQPDLQQYAKVPDLLVLAQKSFANYLEWKIMTKFNPLYMEPHLVSEIYKYGLTPDCIAEVGAPHNLAVFDWKTGSGVYADMLIQMAAYEHGWNENHPEQPVTAGAYLLRIDKNTAAFHFHHWLDLSRPWEVFEHLLAIHYAKNDVEDLV